MCEVRWAMVCYWPAKKRAQQLDHKVRANGPFAIYRLSFTRYSPPPPRPGHKRRISVRNRIRKDGRPMYLRTLESDLVRRRRPTDPLNGPLRDVCTALPTAALRQSVGSEFGEAINYRVQSVKAKGSAKREKQR